MIAFPHLRTLGIAMSALVAMVAVASPAYSREIVQVHRATQTAPLERCGEPVRFSADAWAPAPLQIRDERPIMPDYAAAEIGDYWLRSNYYDQAMVRASIRTIGDDSRTAQRVAPWPRVQRAASGY